MIPPDTAERFLAGHGWGGAAILPLAGDASFRRYFRVVRGDRQAVLMDAPPPQEDPRPFIAIADYLTQHGFAAPRILASDLEAGLVLLEDLGSARMAETIAGNGALEEGIYTRAVDLLLRLRKCPPATCSTYAMSEYLREALLFTQWYAPAVGLVVDEAGYEAAWRQVLADVERHRTVTVLRDYHAENIMLVDPALGVEGLGLLDFQDALVGHPTYDLVSLLQDARRDVSAELEARMLARYRSSAELDDAAYAILGAQRNAKILGIFTRLWKRDGKPRYLRYQGRVWNYLERDLTNPALAPVASWFANNVPGPARASFPYAVAI
jgi:aminoglycoside/choline kinase family phosphotransferase